MTAANGSSSMASKPITRRRILIALAITAILGAGLVAGVAAATGPGDNDAPDHFATAGPKAGDKGNFTITRIDPTKDVPVEAETWAFTYTQLPRQTIIDAAGVPRWVDGITLEIPGRGSTINGVFVSEPITYFFDSNTGDSVATQVPLNMALGAPGQSGFPAVPSGWEVATHGVRLVRQALGAADHETQSVRVPCFLRHTLQGESTAIQGWFALTDKPCSTPAGYWAPSLTMRAIGTEQLAGHDTVIFGNDGNPNDELVWLSAALPVPVKVAFEVQDDPGHFAVLRLASFHRGAAQLAEAPRDLGSIAPPVIRGPAFPYGPREEVNVPFPLSEAWATASADASGPLQGFLEDHPGAFVVVAEGSHKETQKRTIDAWFMVVAAGDARIMFTIEKETRPIEDETMPWFVPLTTGQTEVVYHYHERTRTTIGAIPDAPVVMPTVDSMMKRWDAEKGPDHAGVKGNTWGFRLGCISLEPCTPSVSMWAGFDLEYADEADIGDTIAADNARIFRSSRIIDETRGAPVLEERRVESAQTPLAAAATPVAADTSSNQALVSAIPAAGIPPTWLAGSAVIAALTGLGYLLWPMRHVAGIGLFSRVTGPALLEHPARQRLYDTIEQNPGIHLKALARAADSPRQSSEYHVRRLAREGLVQIKVENGYTCIWPAGRFDRKVTAAVPYVKAKGAQQVMLAIARGPLAVGEVAQRTGLSPSTVSYHVKALDGSGLIERNGRELRLSALGRDVMAAVRLGRT